MKKEEFILKFSSLIKKMRSLKNFSSFLIYADKFERYLKSHYGNFEYYLITDYLSVNWKTIQFNAYIAISNRIVKFLEKDIEILEKLKKLGFSEISHITTDEFVKANLYEKDDRYVYLFGNLYNYHKLPNNLYKLDYIDRWEKHDPFDLFMVLFKSYANANYGVEISNNNKGIAEDMHCYHEIQIWGDKDNFDYLEPKNTKLVPNINIQDKIYLGYSDRFYYPSDVIGIVVDEKTAIHLQKVIDMYWKNISKDNNYIDTNYANECLYNDIWNYLETQKI